MNLNRFSLEAQELILTRFEIEARRSNRRLESLYYKIRLKLVKHKINRSYKGRSGRNKKKFMESRR